MSQFYEGEVCLAGICGNISSGKSTLIERIRSEITDRPEFMVVDEPVEKWETMKVDGKKILEAFYDNKEEMSFTFQIYALLTRYESLKEALSEAKERSKYLGRRVIVIMERTILDDYHIFAKMLFKDKKMSGFEMKVYEKWYLKFLEEFHLNKTVYVTASPELCFERVQLRNRDGEDKITIDYLKSCHEQHEEFYENVLKNHNCIPISTNADKNSDEYSTCISDIFDHFQG